VEILDLAYPPAPGSTLCSRQGPRASRSAWHNGTDWCAPVGTPIPAVAFGEVVLVELCGYTCPYGNRIVVQHADDLYSLYAHLEDGSVRVTEGSRVVPGQVIARMGDTTNLPHVIPHLHFELMRRGPRLAHTDYAARYDVLHVLAASGLVLDGTELAYGEPTEYYEPALVQAKSWSEADLSKYVPVVPGMDPFSGSSDALGWGMLLLGVGAFAVGVRSMLRGRR